MADTPQTLWESVQFEAWRAPAGPKFQKKNLILIVRELDLSHFIFPAVLTQSFGSISSHRRTKEEKNKHTETKKIEK